MKQFLKLWLIAEIQYRNLLISKITGLKTEK